MKTNKFILIAISLLFLVSICHYFYSRINTYRIYISMDTVGSLSSGDKITVRGVQIGKVSDISFSRDKIFICLRINDIYKIPSKSVFTCQPYSVLGERSISIDFMDTSNYIQEGDTIYDQQFMPGLENIKVNNGMNAVKTIRNLSTIIDNIDSLKQSIEKMRKTQ